MEDKITKANASLSLLARKNNFLVIILLIILPVIGFFLGAQYKQTDKTQPIQTGVSECSKQLADKEEEIWLCVEDRASGGSTTNKAPYDFKDFGIYSSLFKDKEVESQTFKYKRQDILRQELVLDKDEQGDSTSGVIVWEYKSVNVTVGSSPTASYVIFDGYENHGIHPTIIDPNSKDKEGYVNPKSLKMVWGYEYCPESICRVTLSFFSQYTPTGHPIYTQIWANNSGYLKESGLNSPGINQTKDKLMKLADQIEDFSTHH